MTTSPSRREKKFMRNFCYWLIIALLLSIMLFSLYWIVIGSFKHTGEHFSSPPKFLPSRWSFKAYADSLEHGGAKGIKDSMFIAVTSMSLSVVLGSFAAYSLVRFRAGSRNAIIWILTIQMLPPISVALPLFLFYRLLKWLDTYQALIISDTVFNLPYAIWLLSSYFEELPQQIEEAAIVDGCSRFQAFLRVALPLSTPGLVVTAFFTFMFTWNEFLLALLFTRRNVMPLTVIIPTLSGADTIIWEQVYSISVVAIGPVIFLAMMLQRYLVRGLTFGAVKG